MIDLDQWQEIYFTLKKNKLRTFLTGFSVAWGIFMLVLLLAAGKGFENGVKSNFSDMSPTMVEIGGGETSLSYKGLKPGREITFVEEDLRNIQSNIPQLEFLSAEFHAWGDNFVSYKNKEGNYNIIACHADYNKIEINTIQDGRFINKEDVEKKRKVAVIGSNIKEALFKNTNPIGKYFIIKGVPFLIIGYFKDQGKPWRLGRILIPYSTSQLVYNGNGFKNIMISLKKNITADENNKAVDNIKKILAAKHLFDPQDPKAIWMFNFTELLNMIGGLFIGINIFVWIIGIGTIIAGIVGVSNIMIITVKERTKEIGIRKALGATPNSIISLIVKESMFITSIFGYIGLAAGVILIELVNLWLSQSDINKETFANPEINLNVGLAAIVLLTICGVIAGFIPALKASKVPPIEALRAD
ncbi:MAG: ABC transporter permease [Cytophagales bacterium]|nr:MAG: ABC transporter permease [Cytophagales bacterium]